MMWRSFFRIFFHPKSVSFFSQSLCFTNHNLFHLFQGRFYKCRFCHRTFTGDKTGTSYFNLRGHRNGSASRPVCKMRHRAIAAGMELLPSYQEQQELIEKPNQGTLAAFLSGPTFTVELLNMLLVMWVVRHALPWSRFEDPTLRAAFHSVNRGAVVRSRCWAAQQSVILYSDLHNKAINTVKVSTLSFVTFIFCIDIISNLYLNRWIKANSASFMTFGLLKVIALPLLERAQITSTKTGITNRLT